MRNLKLDEDTSWCAVAFGDLHVNAKTVDRALDVLARIRKLAKEHGAFVVCTGDFWDARGVLAVRQVDAILTEFERWQTDRISAVFVPGNHDQVTPSGLVHGVRIFEPFSRFTVATHPVFDYEKQIAYLPWREDPAEQTAQFESVPAGWTVFGHAEVGGARSNGGHVAAGRVSAETIKSRARACYLGHYHKRQVLGGSIHYIGSPFEMNFGEMGDPHGVAIVRSESPESPAFVDFDDLPKHVRLVMGDDASRVRAGDIVEVYADRDQLGSEAFGRYVRTIEDVAGDVRPMPKKVAERDAEAPAFALRLDDALVQYAATTDMPSAWSREDIEALGKALLAEVPNRKSAGSVVSEVNVLGVEISNFCAVRGTVKLDLEKQGLVLVRGPIGVGKTAIMDAISWCLYGETAPRKAGSHGATLRADEVVNDFADRCAVEVSLNLGSLYERVVIRREKKRGSGARVAIHGYKSEAGVIDSQDVIEEILGLNYSLWRTCVSLGQGAVGNFVTDADKNRKALLAAAFGLDACPTALEQVRSRAKALRAQNDRSRSLVLGAERAIDTLKSMDFESQIQTWEQTRKANIEVARKAEQQARAAAAECDRNLVEEARWADLKAQHDAHLRALLAQATKLTGGSRAVELEREIGAAQAERSLADQQRARLQAEADRLEAEFAASAALPCPTCGKPMEATHAEKHIAEKHHEIQRFANAMRTFDSKLMNLRAELDNLQATAREQRQAIDAQIQASQDALKQIDTALAQFARFRSNKNEAERRLSDAIAAIDRETKQRNPFEAEQEKLRAKLAEEQAKHDALRKGLEDSERQAAGLDFWEQGFSAKGIPVLVLRTVIHELEAHANRFLAQLLGGRVYCQVTLESEDIAVRLFERVQGGEVRERRYEQLSGGQRRCVEMSFSPFALSEMVFARCGVRIPLLVVDELTTHLGQDEKPIVCDILRSLNRDTVIVIDHDLSVQGEFDVALDVRQEEGATRVDRVIV